ncbi:hypothetical protein ColTof3_07318 [Colletotrichum tofieldiae]|nr:hypothetical protein ColTof3_07318 [Colletotrichum tofieldiae]GKT91344.1 hypothetical protein Ct61P_09194 [Colletotrichum tofieldiae]
MYKVCGVFCFDGVRGKPRARRECGALEDNLQAVIEETLSFELMSPYWQSLVKGRRRPGD